MKYVTTKHVIALESQGQIVHALALPIGETVEYSAAIYSRTEHDEAEELLKPEFANKFPQLPAMGKELKAGDIFRSGSVLVMVRQDHTQTEHEPATVPALFLTHHEAGDRVDWITGEQVRVGDVRKFDELLYKCRQSHVTQDDWTPPQVGALWSVHVDVPPDVIPAWKPWTGHNADLYQVDAKARYKGAIWTATLSNNHWEPGVAGWSK